MQQHRRLGGPAAHRGVFGVEQGHAVVEIERRERGPAAEPRALAPRHAQCRRVVRAGGDAPVGIERTKERQPRHQHLPDDVVFPARGQREARFGAVVPAGEEVEHAGRGRADGNLHRVARGLEFGQQARVAEPAAVELGWQLGAAQRREQLDPRQEAVFHLRLLAIDEVADRLGIARFHVDRAAGEKVGVEQHAGAVGGALGVAAVAAARPVGVEQPRHVGQRLFPVLDEHVDHEPRARLVGPAVAPADVERELAEAVAVVDAAEHTAEHQRPHGEPVGRLRRHAVADGKPRAGHADQRQQVRLGEVGRARDAAQQRHGRADFRVVGFAELGERERVARALRAERLHHAEQHVRQARLARQLHAERAGHVDTDVDRLGVAVLRVAHADAQAVALGALLDAARALDHHARDLLEFIGQPERVRALRERQVDADGGVVVVVPRGGRKQLGRRAQHAARALERQAALRPRAGHEPERGEAAALGRVGEQRGTEDDVHEDFDHARVELGGREVAYQQPADAQVALGAARRVEALVHGLPHAVVLETVTRVAELGRRGVGKRPARERFEHRVLGVERHDHTAAHGRRQPQRGGARARALHAGEGLQVELAAHARGAVEQVEAVGRQPVQAVGDECGHVVGHLEPGQLRQFPDPRVARIVVVEKAALAQRVHELADEKRVARRDAVDVRGQALHARCVGVQRVGEQLGHVAREQRPEGDVDHHFGVAAQCLERGVQRVAGADLVGAIAGHEHEVRQAGVDGQRFQQLPRRRVGPLHVVEKEQQRRVARSEHGQQAADHEVQAAFGVARRHLGHVGLRPDECVQLGQRGREQLAMRAEGLAQRHAAARELRFGFGELAAQQAAQGLQQRQVGQGGAELVELAAPDPALQGGAAALQRGDEGRLADAARARHRDHHPRARSRLRHRVEQARALGVAPIEPVGDAKTRTRVALAECESPHRARAAQFGDALAQVVRQALRARVAVVGVLRHQPRDDVAHRLRVVAAQLAQRRHRPRDMRMRDLGRRCELERQAPGRELE